MVYRIATHPHSPASAVEVLRGMTLDEVCEAHDALDMIDATRPPEGGNG